MYENTDPSEEIAHCLHTVSYKPPLHVGVYMTLSLPERIRLVLIFNALIFITRQTATSIVKPTDIRAAQ